MKRWKMSILVAGFALLFVINHCAQAGLSFTNNISADTEIKAGRTTPGGYFTSTIIGTHGGNLVRSLCGVTHRPGVQDGYVLTNATLYLYQDLSNGYGKDIDIYRILKNWDEPVANWYSNTTTTAWTSPGLSQGIDYVATPTDTATAPTSNGFTAFDVTDDMEEFVAGSTPSVSWVTRLHIETGLGRFRTLNDDTPEERPYVVCQFAKQVLPGTIITNSITQDTYISVSNPNILHGTYGSMLVGFHGGGDGVVRGLLSTSVANIPPNATVLNAQVEVYQDYAPGENRSIALHRVLKPWNEASATWNSNTVTSAWSVPGLGSGSDYKSSQSALNYMPMDTQTYFCVTEDVQAFVSGAESNYGWIMINQQESGLSLDRFPSRTASDTFKRPQLIIRYSVPQGTLIIIK